MPDTLRHWAELLVGRQAAPATRGRQGTRRRPRRAWTRRSRPWRDKQVVTAMQARPCFCVATGIVRSSDLAQLLELMDQEAREQPWAGADDETQLPEQREG